MTKTDTLTKACLSNHLMDKLQFTRMDADLLVDTFLKSMIAALQEGEGVELRGFGSFRLRNRDARIGRNPRSGQTIMIPPKRVVYFKLGKDLRARLMEAQPTS